MDTKSCNALVLAYIGDAVLEILTREYLVVQKKIVKPNLLQSFSIQYVSAKAQARYVEYALEKNIFTDDEISFFKRGKNAKDTRTLKNTSPLTHRISSGFEAILGHLYITRQNERIQEIFNDYTLFVENNTCHFETNLR